MESDRTDPLGVLAISELVGPLEATVRDLLDFAIGERERVDAG